MVSYRQISIRGLLWYRLNDLLEEAFVAVKAKFIVPYTQMLFSTLTILLQSSSNEKVIRSGVIWQSLESQRLANIRLLINEISPSV